MHVLLWGNEIDKLYGNFLWVVPTRWHSSRFVPGDVPARRSASTENPQLFRHVLDLPLCLNLMLISLQRPGPVLYSIQFRQVTSCLAVFAATGQAWIHSMAVIYGYINGRITESVAGDFAIGVCACVEDGTSCLRCHSVRPFGSVYMVNIVRGQPRCWSHDLVDITVRCQQHLVRVGNYCFSACTGRFDVHVLFGQSLAQLAHRWLHHLLELWGISLHSIYVPGKPLHWASVESCNMWQVERHSFPQGTPRSIHWLTWVDHSGSFSVWPSLLNRTDDPILILSTIAPTAPLWLVPGALTQLVRTWGLAHVGV